MATFNKDGIKNMSRRLDHSKGGNYAPDPARVQKCPDFVEPDNLVVVKGRPKPKPGSWEMALQIIQQNKKKDAKDLKWNLSKANRETKFALTQKKLIAKLGYTTKDLSIKNMEKFGKNWLLNAYY